MMTKKVTKSKSEQPKTTKPAKVIKNTVSTKQSKVTVEPKPREPSVHIAYIDPKRQESQTSSETYFGRIGQEVKSLKKEGFYGRIFVQNGVEYYYIRTYQNAPYDPLGPYSRRFIYNDTVMKQVSKDTFDFYMLYLRSNNNIYLTKAQRGKMND